MLHLVIDSKIPYMRGFAEQLGTVTYLPGNEITAADVREADALIVRTRTRCDRQLLEGSRVKFIATATIGYDHLDTDYLAQAGIAWTNCPGCNADSVAQYIESSLLLLAAHGLNPIDSTATLTPIDQPAPCRVIDRSLFAALTLGIVGVGHVGQRVEAMAQRMGFGRILRCDPPRAEREGTDDRGTDGKGSAKNFCTLEELAHEADIITFHTPLTHAPQPHPTFHLADTSFFNSLRRRPVIINSSRGEVVDTAALKQALHEGRIRTAVIDTWENEPAIDRELLNQVFIGTPHIAGYSADGKANGTRMSLQAVARHFHLPADCCAAIEAPCLPPAFAYFPEGEGQHLAPELRLYDPSRDCLALRAQPSLFEKLRGDYPLRRERD